VNKPNELEIEASVLGAILLESSCLLEIANLLKPQHFFSNQNAEIYKAMLHLHNNGIEIDTITVYNHLKKDALYLEQLKSKSISTANIITHAQILIELWLKRQGVKIAEAFKQAVLDDKEDVFTLYSKLIESAEKRIDIKGASKSDMTLWERLPEFFNQLDEERKHKTGVTLKSEWFPTFNTATGGLRDGDYLLITGKWKRGKSRFANALSVDFAINKNIPVGLISFEMSDVEFIKMIMSMCLGVRYEYLRDPSYTNKNGELRLNDSRMLEIKSNAENTFHKSKIYLSDEVTTDYELYNLIRNWKHKHNVNVIVVDYLQLVGSVKKYEAKRLQIDDISATLKNIARSLKLKVIVIVQENEQGKTNEARGPIRDCDFWFSSSYPYGDKEGTSEIKIDGRQIEVNESHFIINYKESRHNKSGGKWVNIFHEDGSYKEWAHEYEEVI